MLNSKIIDIFKSFSEDEIKKFREFLNSPFHNKNKKAISLFEILSKYHPHYQNKNLIKENLYQQIFFNGKNFPDYNDASLRNLLSDLMILAEKFLAHISFESDDFYFNERILKELSERKLVRIFEKNLKTGESAIIKKEFEGEGVYYKKFVIEELKSSSSQFYDDLKLYKSDFNIKASEYLTYFYFIKIFKMINFFEFQKQYNIDNLSNIAEKVIKELNFSHILESVKQKSMDDYLILSVYIKMYQALANPDDDEYYFNFKKKVLENDNLFSLLERYGLYICMTNSCVQKIDKGNEKFFKECFEIYKIMFEKNLFDVYPGYFSMTTFTAIVTTGVAAKEFDRVEKFIKEYSEKLNPEHKSDALNYSLAQLNFNKKEFGKALEYISQTDTEFSNFKFQLKILLLKIYFELGDYDSLYYTSDSFTHFLNKNKIVGKNYKIEFNNFIKILDLLIKFKFNKEQKYSFKIKKSLENTAIASRRWLIEKFKELNN